MENALETPTLDPPASGASSHEAPAVMGKSERRRQAILVVARELFQAQGYAATSMSEIAARLGGSKGTLYNYFRSKEELFAAFMQDNCQVGADEVFQNLGPAGEDLRRALTELGMNFMTFLLKPETMAVHRLVVAEGERFPELGRIFYEAGPKRGQESLVKFFGPLIEQGRMRPGDPLEVSRWFKDILLANIYNRKLWGVIDTLTPEETRAHVDKAVEVFLAAFG